MKNQAFVSSKDKSRMLKCRLLEFLFDALRFKRTFTFLYKSLIPPHLVSLTIVT